MRAVAPLLAIAIAIAVAVAVAIAAPAAAERQGEVARLLHNPPGEAPILGPRYAPVTIELFIDLESSSSRRVYRDIHELARRHPIRLRTVFWITRAGGQASRRNETAIEAFAQGKFHRFLGAYFGDAFHHPSEAQLEGILEEAGIDRTGLEAAIASSRHVAAIRAGYTRARRFGVHGIPSAMINGEPVPRVPGSLSAWEELYDSAYAEASELLAEGYPVAEIYPRLLRRRAAGRSVPHIEIRNLDGRRPAALSREKNGYPLRGAIDYAGPHTRWATDAPVVIATFCRLGRRECLKLHETLAELEAAFEGEIRHVFKPLYDSEETPRAHPLHLAAECAAEQGQFWPVWEQILRRSPVRDPGDALERIKPILDDLERFERCLAEERVAPALAAEVAASRRAGVLATPATVIGSRIYYGEMSFEDLVALVELELAPGLLGRWLDPLAATP
jgi:protein-disulfide isomerase